MTALLQPASIADPYAYFGTLREEDPVHFDAEHKSWLLTRYEDVAAGFMDKRLSSNRVEPVFDRLDEEERAARAPVFELLSNWMVFKDPPDHTRLRSLVRLAFTPRAVAALGPRIEEVVDHVLDLPDAGTVDVVEDIAYPIPAMVIAEMLGVPAEDRDVFRSWSNDVSALIFEGDRADMDRERAQSGLVALADYLHGLVRASRRSPGDDLISALVRAHDAEDALSEEEVVSTCVLLLFAGHETTAHLISNAFLALLRHPDQARLLLEQPECVPDAVEELNRYDGSAKMSVRRAVADVELHGCTIEAGRRVLLVQAAANRDPRQFRDADRLDLRRSETRNVAFGFGIHYCLGAPLARLETQIALPRMLRKLRGAEVDEDRLEYLPVLLTRGLRSLPVRYGA